MLFGKLFTNPKMWVNGNANEITMGGVYTCKDVQNVPTGDGALFVFKTEDTVKQVFVPVGEEGAVYTRVIGEEWGRVTGTSEETGALIQSAIDKANQAQAKADTVDTRLNNIIVESGTSDAEVVAARTDSSGHTFTTLGQRLDTQFSEKRGFDSILGYAAILFGYGRVEIDTVEKTITVSTAYTLKIGKLKLNNTAIDISGLDTTSHQTIYYDNTDKKVKIVSYGGYGSLANVNNTAILGSTWPSNPNYPRGYYSLNTNMPIFVDGVRQIATIDTMKGLTINAFGDSICQMRTDTGSGTATYATITLKKLSERYLGVPYNSHAVGGKHWCNFGANLDLYGQLSEADALNGNVVLIWAGTNDYSGGAPIGTIDDEPNWSRADTSSGTFFSNAKYCLDYIYSINPDTEIVLITPTYRNYCGSTIGNAYTTVKNSAGHTLGDYCDAIVELGRYYNIPVFDMRDNCAFNERTISSMVVEQGAGTGKYLHPKDATYTILNRKIINWLKTVL